LRVIKQRKPRRCCQPPGGLPRHGQGIARRQHRAYLGVVKHVLRLRHAKFRIHRHHDCADARKRKQRQRMPIAVARHHRNTITFTDTTRQEQPCRPFDRRAKDLPRPRRTVKENEFALRIARRATGKSGMKGVVVRGVPAQDFERFLHFG